MKCQEIEALIHKELDGELTEEELRLLIAHIRECPRCRARRESLHHLAAVARELPVPSLRSSELPEVVTRSLRRRSWLRVAVGVGLAAAGILLVVTLWLHRPPSAPTGTPPGPHQPVAHSGIHDARPASELDNQLLAEAGLTWLESAGRQAAAETAGFARLLMTGEQEPTAPPEEPGWLVELEETGDALLHVSREVGARIVPFEALRGQHEQRKG